MLLSNRNEFGTTSQHPRRSSRTCEAETRIKVRGCDEIYSRRIGGVRQADDSVMSPARRQDFGEMCFQD